MSDQQSVKQFPHRPTWTGWVTAPDMGEKHDLADGMAGRAKKLCCGKLWRRPFSDHLRHGQATCYPLPAALCSGEPTLPKAVITVRPGPDGEIPRFNRISRKSSDDAFAALGAPVLLFAPRDEALHGYFGMALLQAVELDVTDPAFLLAELVVVQLFPAPVPLAIKGQPYERVADDPTGDVPWWYYLAPARPISDVAFSTVLAAAAAIDAMPPDYGTLSSQRGFDEALASASPIVTYSAPYYRPSQELVRSARLRAEVLLRHGPICALTDGNLVSPDGIAEVEVCHIRSLAAGGPNIVRNALPMTRTVHWGFDLGLVSLTHDGIILVSKTADDKFRAHLNKSKGRANFPKDPNFWPDPEFIDYHRRWVFRDG